MKKRTVHNSLSAAFQNWTLDNVSVLLDDYARGFREPLNDAETEWRRYSGEEINKVFRMAQLDLNMMGRLVKLGQLCLDQMKVNMISPEKARELSGEIPPWNNEETTE